MIPEGVHDWPYIAITHTAEGWAWDVFFQNDAADRGGVEPTLMRAFVEVADVIEANKN